MKQWGLGSGQWRVGSGEWRVGSGEWGVGSGQWRVGSGQWRVKSIVDSQVKMSLKPAANCRRYAGIRFKPPFHTTLITIISESQ
jgi:hypothetical protein